VTTTRKEDREEEGGDGWATDRFVWAKAKCDVGSTCRREFSSRSEATYGDG
jgi:hypothetical protein